ncbi:hypothetical protein INT45_013271 [Circinella minor]|uniref:Uncharacterized protein n=1 Tax=Circinella minor TaxID=1195481 RepID=A0A8H7S3D8_9FUNG|nr:hypothetical protein INT45_013271 [Circinella minor]
MYGSSQKTTLLDMQRKRNGFFMNPDNNTSSTLVANQLNNNEKNSFDRNDSSVDVQSIVSSYVESDSSSSSSITNSALGDQHGKFEYDGGYQGWLVVLGSSLASFTVFGTMMSW